MEPTTLHPAPVTGATQRSPEDASPDAPAGQRPRLDLTRMEPPQRLEEARLEEVTIDGICGVY